MPNPIAPSSAACWPNVSNVHPVLIVFPIASTRTISTGTQSNRLLFWTKVGNPSQTLFFINGQLTLPSFAKAHGHYLKVRLSSFKELTTWESKAKIIGGPIFTMNSVLSHYN